MGARSREQLVSVRLAVRERQRQLGWSDLRLAEEAGLSYNVIREFLEGRRDWPRAKSRAAIERALGWGPGSFDRIAAGSDSTTPLDQGKLRSESAESHQVSIILGFPAEVLEGASELAKAEARARAEAAYLRTLLEHQGVTDRPASP
jgi:transcriptional regulator with XRE-family HTH domain